MNCLVQLFDKTKYGKNEKGKQINIISSIYLPAQYFIRTKYQLEEPPAIPKAYDQPESRF
jgi:hypothetical protein